MKDGQSVPGRCWKPSLTVTLLAVVLCSNAMCKRLLQPARACKGRSVVDKVIDGRTAQKIVLPSHALLGDCRFVTAYVMIQKVTE